MMLLRHITNLLTLTVLLSPVASRGDDGVVPHRASEVAKPRALPDGAPKASDVIMRSLTLRESDDPNQHDTLRALSDFHVSRLEWAYIQDRDAIATIRNSGRLFGGAASSALSHVARQNDRSSYAKLACVNLLGEPVVPSWKRTWKPPGAWWMCANNPETERSYVEYLKACLDAGAQVMQRDEPGGNDRATYWGGCFCDHCVEAFRSDLAENTTAAQHAELGINDIATFDYRETLKRQNAPVGDAFKRWDGGRLKERFLDFQIRSTIAFHQRTRQALNEHAGRRVAMSCNNGCRRWTDIELLFDWCFGELSYRDAHPDFIHDAMQRAEEFGRRQVITMPKKSDREGLDAWRLATRQTIAMAYASGGHCMVPWDVYMPSDAPRYFGAADEYADLFGFIRASSQYLDGYEFAGAMGPGISCDLYGKEFPARTPAGSRVCSVIRAVAGDVDAAVVVHLIDWSEDPQAFCLTLNPTLLFGDRPWKLTLLTPPLYNQAQHARAEETRVYGELLTSTELRGGHATSIPIPALSPWGLVVIEPDDTAADGVWQPTIHSEESGLFRETLSVRMATASPKASLRFTIDGSLPTAASPRYTSPIELSDDATLQAVAVGPDGRTSSVATAKFTKRSDGPQALAPNSSTLGKDLKLWLAADSLPLADGEPVESWTALVGPNAVAEPHRTFGGRTTQPPRFRANAINGRGVVRFDGVDDSLAVREFANRHLAGTAFTIFMVTQSVDDGFGMCGNGIWGSGGDPRLYLQRSAFRYDELGKVVSLRPAAEGPSISVFQHDGQETISAASNGVPSAAVSGLAVVEEFGSGGNLAFPFWSGNTNCAGDMAEIIVFDRQLTEEERTSVEAYLADEYAIQYIKRWDRVDLQAD